jgi:hypothetical protein
LRRRGRAARLRRRHRGVRDAARGALRAALRRAAAHTPRPAQGLDHLEHRAGVGARRRAASARKRCARSCSTACGVFWSATISWLAR